MRQGYRILPVYAGDVSGAASALYELGGMCVIHDPSGCNSTYNTHDEIRWFDQDSLIFISALQDLDAIMGNDEKLIDDVLEAAAAFRPKFIALMNSPIPYIMGTDFPAISRIIEERSGIPTFYVPTNAMHDYVRGAGLAWKMLAEKMLFKEALPGKLPESIATKSGKRKKAFTAKGRVNILGLTPLDFTAEGSVQSLISFLQEEGWHVQSDWALEVAQGIAEADQCFAEADDIAKTEEAFADSSNSVGKKGDEPKKRDGSAWETLLSAPQADLNLLLSSTGLPLAEFMQKKAGIPYVAGIPVYGFREELAQAMERACQSRQSIIAYIEADLNTEENTVAKAKVAAEESTVRKAKAAAEKSTVAKTKVVAEESTVAKVKAAVKECAVADGKSAEDVRITQEEASSAEMQLVLIGEPVIMGSLAAALEKITGCPARVFVATEDGEKLIDPARDLILWGEEEVESALQKYVEEVGENKLLVIADPMYRPILPAGCHFLPLPHFAFSGRIYRREMKNLFSDEMKEWMKLI